MVHDTGPAGKSPSRKITQRERALYRREIKRRGWTQNEAARRIGKDHGLFSRWLRGEFPSAVIRLALLELLASTVPPEENST